MNNNTIFDDVFRTMVEKMTYLLVPLINEVFHTSYPEDVKIVHLRNEHQLEDGELITDARLLIGDKVYHIECQSTDDATMAIRMFEYDLAIALESRRRVGRRFFVEFPRSCVIYLRTTKNTPDVEEVELKLPDGQVCVYRVPTVKVERYTKDSIFEKNLLMLLPFYVMRYEELAHGCYHYVFSWIFGKISSRNVILSPSRKAFFVSFVYRTLSINSRKILFLVGISRSQ